MKPEYAAVVYESLKEAGINFVATSRMTKSTTRKNWLWRILTLLPSIEGSESFCMRTSLFEQGSGVYQFNTSYLCRQKSLG